MSEGRLLVVEDDRDIATMLRFYFDTQGYQTLVAPRGEEALDICRRQAPHLVILDIMLPDIDGYEVCRRLRANARMAHIPIIFLTQRDERSDQIAGLELGADDYVTKPFDLQLLLLRVQGALRRAEWLNHSHPVTGLPTGKLIEEHLRHIIRRSDWSMLYIGIGGLQEFNEVYGFLAGDDVLRFTAMMLQDVVEELGTESDFVGYAGGDDFLITTMAPAPAALQSRLVERFNDEVRTFYAFRDRERGYVEVLDGPGRLRHAPLMTLAVGLVDSASTDFADIREITEVAARARRRQQAG